MCWKCSLPIDNTREIFRTSVCPECGSDLHSCKNCRFYEIGSHYDCHETIDELVKDKERANFCDYFSVNENLAGNKKSELEIEKSRNAFNDLFSI